MSTKRELELQAKLDDAITRVAVLEKQRPQVVICAPELTAWQKYEAEGGTLREWKKHLRRAGRSANV